MLPAAVRDVTDALEDVDRAVLALLYGPGLDGLPDGAQRILVNFGLQVARTMDDLLALYLDFHQDPTTQEKEEIWKQASL